MAGGGNMAWTRLGGGTYNRTYRSADSRTVLKVQRDSREATDTPLRSVRIWNQINTDLPPAAIAKTTHGDGWTCPYVEGRQSTDPEMSGALVDIYSRTGRIIVDATAPKNFVTTPRGQVVCVDIGMALQMERSEEAGFVDARRRHSIVSRDAWTRSQHSYGKFFSDSARVYPDTVDTVKALLFIKANRPDIFDVGFLKTKPELIKRLARAYEVEDTAILREFDIEASRARTAPSRGTGPTAPTATVPPAMVPLYEREADLEADRDLELDAGRGIGPSGYVKGTGLLSEFERLCAIESGAEVGESSLAGARAMLDRERGASFSSLQGTCVAELNRYISSRGKINHEGVFEPSFKTKVFRDEALTARKVEYAHNLIGRIKAARSPDELDDLLKEATSDKELAKSKFASGFIASIGRCRLALENSRPQLGAGKEAQASPSPDY